MADTFYNPGAAAANALQTILARQTLQERQRMMDELTKQKTLADIDAQRETVAANKEWRESLAEERRETAKAKLAGSLTPGQTIPHETAGRLDPSWVVPPPGPPSAEDNYGVPPALAQPNDEYDLPRYTGTYGQLEPIERRRRISDLMGSESWKNAGELERAILYNEASGNQGIPAGAFGGEGYDGPAMDYDPVTGQAKPLMVDGKPVSSRTKIVSRGRPPVAGQPFGIMVVDPSTGTATPATDPDTGAPVRAPGGSRVITTPQASQGAPPALLTALQRARKEAVPTGLFNKSIPPEKQAALDQAVANFVTAYKVSDRVKAAARMALTNPSIDTMDTGAIVAALQPKQGSTTVPLSDAEKTQLTNIISVALGRQ